LKENGRGRKSRRGKGRTGMEFRGDLRRNGIGKAGKGMKGVEGERKEGGKER